MKIYLQFLKNLRYNHGFYLCLLLAIISLFFKAPLLALTYGIIFPLTAGLLHVLQCSELQKQNSVKKIHYFSS